MEQDFFTNLPSEILINILSRLPIRTIISCKCVCKSWLELLETDEFVTFHLSKAAPGLVVLGCNVYELEDAVDLERHELHYNPVAEFDHTAFMSHHSSLRNSANGLILLSDESSTKPDSLYVCNPITREYIELHSPRELVATTATYGFGVSKITGQHKVVRISHERITPPKSECRVYTLGTRSWRSTESGAGLDYCCLSHGVFLNGKLHWLVPDLDDSQHWISCFDLETEQFSTLSPPPALGGLFHLRGCLCLTDYSSDDELGFWLMKEYGDEESWMKEFVISRIPYPIFEPCETVYPIKFFENGDVLMACEDYFFFYYSVRTKTTHRVDIPQLDSTTCANVAMVHTLSFLSLKIFRGENVRSF